MGNAFLHMHLMYSLVFFLTSESTVLKFQASFMLPVNEILPPSATSCTHLWVEDIDIVPLNHLHVVEYDSWSFRFQL